MKKTFIKISAFATIGLVLASCNNEEANNKLREADDLAVQELVNAKELELDAAVWAECDAKVLVAAEEAVAANAKKSAKPVAKKPAAKPAPVAETAKEEPKPTIGSGKPAMGNASSTTVGDGKPKMGSGTSTTVGSGKPKMGGN